MTGFGSSQSLQGRKKVRMIATLPGRCAICSGRIVKGRSKIERTPTGWAHERCTETDPDHQGLVRQRMRRFNSYADRSCPSD